MRRHAQGSTWVNVVAGGCAMLFGLITIVSWHLHWTALLQPGSGWAVVHYNTALALVLCGFALAEIARGRLRAGRWCALAALVLGALTLSQDLFSYRLGIDTALIDPYIPPLTTAPGRMSPQTAVSFVLVGAGIALQSLRPSFRYRLLSVASLASIVVAICAVALIGYAFGIETAYGFGTFNLMSWQTASVLLVLGGALFAAAWSETLIQTSEPPRWLCIPVTVGAAAVAVLLAQALAAHQNHEYERVVDAEGQSIAAELTAELGSQIGIVERIARRWTQTGQSDQDDWQISRQNNLTDRPALEALEWVDTQLQVHWVVARSTDPTSFDHDLRDDLTMRMTLELARASGESAVSGPLHRGDGQSRVVVAHFFQAPNGLSGWIVGEFQVAGLMSAVLSNERIDGYAITVSQADHVVYTSAEDGASPNRWALAEQSTVGGTSYELTIWPIDPGAELGRTPLVALGVGLVVAILLGVAVFGFQSAARAARGLERSNQNLARGIRERYSIIVELQEREARYRAVTEGKPDAFYVYENVRDEHGAVIDYVLVEYNSEATKRLARAGLAPDGLRFSDFIRAADEAEMMATVATVMSTNQVIEQERPIAFVDGRSIWTHQEYVPLPNGFALISRNITERKRVEAALQANEARFRAAAEGGFDAFFAFECVRDDDGEIIDFALAEFNSRAAAMLAVNDLRVVGAKLSAITSTVSPDGSMFAERLRRYTEVLSTGGALEEELQVAAPGKPIVWLQQQVVPLADGVAVTARDVTARKRADEELKRLAFLVESSDDAIIAISLAGDVLSWNHAAELIYGYSTAEVVGKPISILLAADRPGEVEEFLGRIARGERVESFETVRVRHDGSRIDVSVTVSPILDPAGTVVGASTIERDITERKWVETMVRDSAAKFRAILDSAPDSVIISNADGRIMLVNREFELQFGYTRAEMIGQKVDGMLPVPLPGSVDRDHPLLNINPIAHLLGPGIDVTAQRRDGSEFPVEIRLSSVDDSHSGLYVLVVRDMTERKRAEQAIQAAAEALERSNRELQEFAYVASHDLKAPLVSLRGMAAMLVEDYGDRLDDTARLYADRIAFNAGKMQTLLDELLEFSRVGRVDTDLRPLDLSAVVYSVLDQLEHTLTQRRATVQVTTGLPTVRANRSRMTQVFSNLIDNAVKYTPADRSPSIEIGAIDRGNVWEITVADNGSGIPAEFHDKIFGMFQRLPGGKAMDPGGSGMGLAIVSRIIETHGGRCWLNSTEGVGTTFHFTLDKQDAVAIEGGELAAD